MLPKLILINSMFRFSCIQKDRAFLPPVSGYAYYKKRLCSVLEVCRGPQGPFFFNQTPAGPRLHSLQIVSGRHFYIFYNKLKKYFKTFFSLLNASKLRVTDQLCKRVLISSIILTNAGPKFHFRFQYVSARKQVCVTLSI